MLMRFLDAGRDTGAALAASYDHVLTSCSIVAAVLAAYAALGIAEQIRVTRRPAARLLWLGGGAFAMGLGIWTMHFTAMLAYRLPVPVSYDTLVTAVSILPAIAAAAIALHLVSRAAPGFGTIALGGTLMGAGIGAMHYIGMAAMHLEAEMLYSFPRVVLSVVVAVALAVLSLRTQFAFSRATETGGRMRWARPGSALIMGAAVSGMHYTAMTAVYFFPASAPVLAAAGGIVESRELATAVLFTSGMLALLLIVTTHEIELAAQERTAAAMRQHNVELMEALEAGEQAARAKSEFLNNVTHELRTPLNSVIGFSELLTAGVPGPLNAKQAAFAADILASGQHLLALVEGILEMTQLDAAGPVLECERVQIGTALEECVAAHRGAAEAERVSIALEVAADAGSAELDAKVLRRMLDALLDNAVKFNRDGGTVAVRVRRDDGWLEIAVVDTGMGIAREDLPKLFRPLVQLDSGLSRKRGGVGLGLALARRLAERQGGTIEVASEPGHGSVFTLRLPAGEIA